MTQTAFVTGATGFVGTHLVKQLVARQWQVSVLARTNSSLQDIADLPIRIAYGDITDYPSLDQAVPAQTDHFFHIAASTNTWSANNRLQDQTNIEGTSNVLKVVKAKQAGRLIHTSTFVAWGFQNQTITETTTPSDDGLWINYIRSKRTAEQLVKQAVADGLDAVILNPGHILGPYDRHNWSRMIGMIHANKLPGIPPGGGSFSDVREVAKAHIEAALKAAPGEQFLLGGEAASYFDVVQIIGRILQRKVPQRTLPAWLLRLYGHCLNGIAKISRKEPDLTPESVAMVTRHIVCDSSKATQQLGYQTTAVETLLKLTCEWMLEAGLLESDHA